DKARRHALQILDQVLSAGDVTAARDEALAERPHPNVDLGGVDARPVGRAEPARPQYPQRMRLVDHEPGAMPPRHGDEGAEVGHIAVHAVMPFDDEERAAMARPRLGQYLVRRLGIEMTNRDAA